jgi:proline utilization trans-activator
VRIALSLGMNREAPPGCLSLREYQRRRRLWWTLYIIDKKLSTTVGAPLSIQDEDIDISLPEEYDLGFSNAALKFHVRMARLEGKVVSGITCHIVTTLD